MAEKWRVTAPTGHRPEDVLSKAREQHYSRMSHLAVTNKAVDSYTRVRQRRSSLVRLQYEDAIIANSVFDFDVNPFDDPDSGPAPEPTRPRRSSTSGPPQYAQPLKREPRAQRRSDAGEGAAGKGPRRSDAGGGGGEGTTTPGRASTSGLQLLPSPRTSWAGQDPAEGDAARPAWVELPDGAVPAAWLANQAFDALTDAAPRGNALATLLSQMPARSSYAGGQAPARGQTPPLVPSTPLLPSSLSSNLPSTPSMLSSALVFTPSTRAPPPSPGGPATDSGQWGGQPRRGSPVRRFSYANGPQAATSPLPPPQPWAPAPAVPEQEPSPSVTRRTQPLRPSSLLVFPAGGAGSPPGSPKSPHSPQAGSPLSPGTSAWRRAAQAAREAGGQGAAQGALGSRGGHGGSSQGFPITHSPSGPLVPSGSVSCSGAGPLLRASTGELAGGPPVGGISGGARTASLTSGMSRGGGTPARRPSYGSGGGASGPGGLLTSLPSGPSSVGALPSQHNTAQHPPWVSSVSRKDMGGGAAGRGTAVRTSGGSASGRGLMTAGHMQGDDASGALRSGAPSSPGPSPSPGSEPRPSPSIPSPPLGACLSPPSRLRERRSSMTATLSVHVPSSNALSATGSTPAQSSTLPTTADPPLLSGLWRPLPSPNVSQTAQGGAGAYQPAPPSPPNGARLPRFSAASEPSAPYTTATDWAAMLSPATAGTAGGTQAGSGSAFRPTTSHQQAILHPHPHPPHASQLPAGRLDGATTPRSGGLPSLRASCDGYVPASGAGGGASFGGPGHMQSLPAPSAHAASAGRSQGAAVAQDGSDDGIGSGAEGGGRPELPRTGAMADEGAAGEGVLARMKRALGSMRRLAV
ncbi:hypothetical protein HYH03_003314 [Edaphochlamys debaryana]|uniref:Uncharacterized protein n=1 Tax=Edaphochlamys debaryana TaxID=47281 RepID=A0A835YC54_9CHLO|nr:hypothetical protein HYH03_003314 [Edaphochlamys debaryana]|eukprot:KAG2498563.1 hypothetical protein HYH03_003314 [Edaphochlamys debaryana]